MKRFPFQLSWAVGLLALVVAGCSSKGPTVTGKVTLDGKPLADAEVIFQPADLQTGSALGGDTVRTGPDGTFTIEPDPQKHGLKPGKFAVRINKWVDEQGNTPSPEDLEMLKASGGVLKNLVHPRFNREESKELLTVEIKPGDNDLGELKVTSK
jgi:hypothetical protein